MTHFWIIFVRGNKKWGLRAHESTIAGVIAFPTKNAASNDLLTAKKMYGEARLYKFKPEAFILGASK